MAPSGKRKATKTSCILLMQNVTRAHGIIIKERSLLHKEKLDKASKMYHTHLSKIIESI